MIYCRYIHIYLNEVNGFWKLFTIKMNFPVFGQFGALTVKEKATFKQQDAPSSSIQATEKHCS